MATKTDPLKDEAAESTELKFTYDGYDYTVDKEMITDLDVLELFEDDKLIKAIKMILGAKQWAQFRSKRRGSKDLNDLAKLLFAEIGVDPGE